MVTVRLAFSRWLDARREAARTHCCWCLHDLDPLDALTTARQKRVVHPGCLPEADLDEQADASW